ncbi:MAG TPA: DUF5719 family protein [Acidimicrobiales bacterium]|nr:DUF5719 family protein [Acidimicrobiales bacterium]
MTPGWRRAVGIVAIVAILVVVGIIDRSVAPAASPGAAPAPAPVAVSRVAPAAVESAAWYCPGGTGAFGGEVATVLLTNTTGHAVAGTLVAVSSAGPRRSVSVLVPAGGHLSLVPARLVPGSWVAASVTLDGGGVGATQTVSGPHGNASAPCASVTSPTWDFATGSTAGTDALTLALFNPTATPSSVDVGVVTASGMVQPPAYQEIQVPAGAVVTESVGDHAQQEAAVGTEVSALSGSVVALELQQSNEPPGPAVSLQLGTPTPAPVWSVPQSTQVPKGSVIFHLLNPSDHDTVVRVVVSEHQSTPPPLLVALRAQSITALAASTEIRVPVGTPFAVRFSAAHGVGIVVARQVVAPAQKPRPQRGVTVGVANGAPDWVVPLAAVGGVRAQVLAVASLSTGRVTVRLAAEHSGNGVPVPFGTSVLSPGGVLALELPVPAASGVTLEVSATGPVAVEVDGSPAGAPGVVVFPALTVG